MIQAQSLVNFDPVITRHLEAVSSHSPRLFRDRVRVRSPRHGRRVRHILRSYFCGRFLR
jgi:hypothetical protein